MVFILPMLRNRGALASRQSLGSEAFAIAPGSGKLGRMIPPLSRCLPLLWLAGLAQAEELRTVAETTNYTRTASHAEVMSFCRALDKESDKVALVEFGKSHERRALPLLILRKDGLSGEDAAKTAKLPSILAMANIHAGEVEGKEALLMLARELARKDDSQILDHYVVLIAPIYNADGNERFSKDNRPYQQGPAEVGIRENGQGLDLNRDYVKQEAPETRALAKLFRDWDPRMVIDCHTTNGSLHRYTLTYDGPRHPAGDGPLQDFTRRFLPKVGAELKKRSGFDSFWYGNFAGDHQRWEGFPALPRYGSHYMGMRNRIGILSEAYVYASFQDRVLATRDFVHECLRAAVSDREEIARLIREADKRQPAKIALRADLSPEPQRVLAKGYREEMVDGKAVAREPRDYETDLWFASSVTREAAMPHAYLLPSAKDEVVHALQRHGIIVEELREDLDLDLETYQLVEIRRAPEAFQGHKIVSLTTSLRSSRQRVKAGTFVVRTKQALGSLAAYLLEPESEDGLFAWNFLDEELLPGASLPVLRLPSPATMLTTQVRPLPEERKRGSILTFEMLHGEKEKRNFLGEILRVDWLPKGSRYRQEREGVVFVVHAEDGRMSRMWDPAKLKQSLSVLPSIPAEKANELAEGSLLHWNEAGTAALFEYGQDLYHLPVDGSPATRLTQSPGEEELAEFSPDGRWVAFVRADDLYVVDLATKTERRLTTDGGGAIRNGKADWIYFEELYNRDWRAYWWSPDSRRLAFHRFDSSRLPMFFAADTLTLHTELESMRHPKPGDPNPDVKLGLVEVAGGEIDWLSLSDYTLGSFLISHVGWYPDGQSLYFYVQDRAQKWLDFRRRKLGGSQERLFRESTKAWVESPGSAYFLGEDVLFLSERTGWKHLYRFNPASKAWTALTSGDWEIRAVHLVDSKNGWIYFSATKDSSLAQDLYRCHLDGQGLERLTQGDGNHEVSLDPEGGFFVDTWSKIGRPAQARLHRLDGGEVRLLDSNPVHALEEVKWGEATLMQVKARDGVMLEADLIKPPDFDPQKRYPAWFTTYAGPAAPTVRNAWGNERLRAQLLASQGIVVFRMDPRSASGKGACSAWTAYRQLGVKEMADIEDGIQWLKSQDYIDGKRLGMSGHSYGGFMTAYAMTHSKLFCAGISGAPVTDWRLYDSIYTERYMDTPENNLEGYEKTSVVDAAKDLHGKLLLLHGMMDDNVHLQNAARFMKALQEAKKDFRVMLYPEMKHGLHGAHYQRLVFDFVRESLGVEN